MVFEIKSYKAFTNNKLRVSVVIEFYYLSASIFVYTTFLPYVGDVIILNVQHVRFQKL